MLWKSHMEYVTTVSSKWSSRVSASRAENVWVRKEILCFFPISLFTSKGKEALRRLSSPTRLPKLSQRQSQGWTLGLLALGSDPFHDPLHGQDQSDQWPWCYKQLWSPTIQCLSTGHLAPTFALWLAENTAPSCELQRNGKFQVSEQPSLQVSFCINPAFRGSQALCPTNS